MLLRTSLVLTIATSLAVIAITQFKFRARLEGIVAERNAAKAELADMTIKWTTTEKGLKELETVLKSRDQELSTVRTELSAATSRATASETAVARLQSTHAETTTELKAAQQKLAAWNFLGLEPSQVQSMIEQSRKVAAETEAIKAESKVVVSKYAALQKSWDTIFSTTEERPLPAGLKGKVLVVDPKWNFVVLDIGEKQGAVPRGVMLVSRNSKLVGKVKIASTQADRCIANVMPGWKLDDLMEGDQVIY